MSSGTSQTFRTAAAREIKHFVDELAEYIAKKIIILNMSLVRAEGMVTIVFRWLQCLRYDEGRTRFTKRTCNLTARMLAKGGDFAAHKEKNDAKINRTFQLKQNTRISRVLFHLK